MATVVLVDLIYVICEMYIDDCNVFGDNNIEFVSRLKYVFQRFRKHNLYFKANKCSFGYSELEFVGKVITEEVLKISLKKIQSVQSGGKAALLGLTCGGIYGRGIESLDRLC